MVGCTETEAQVPPSDVVEFDRPVSITGGLDIRGSVHFINDTTPTEGPELFWDGHRGAWVSGIDVANNGGSRDFVLAAKYNWPRPKDINDLIYIAHNGEFAPTIGAGVTPPDRSHRFQISAQDGEPAMGTLMLRRSPEQTGNLLTVIDHAGTPRWWVDARYWLKGENPATGASISIKGDEENQRPLAFARADGSIIFGLQYEGDALHLRYLTTGLNNMTLRTNGTPDFPNGLTTKSLRVEGGAPATSSSPCTKGQIASDEDYVYVCVATDTWKRSELTSW